MELYKGLLRSRDESNVDLKEEAPLEREKKKLHKIKHRKIKNLSVKNILYNQQLRRYLRSRKEARDKPIKVEIKETPTSNIKLVAARDPNDKKSIKAAVLNDDGELENVKIEQKIPGVRFSEPEEDVFSTARSSVSSVPSTRSSRTTSSRTMSSSSYSSNGEMEKSITPKSKFFSEPKNILTRNLAQEKLEVIKTRKKELMHIIKSNPNKFGVTKAGEIINPTTGKAFAYSNLEWAIDRLVNPVVTNAPSPVGMKQLKKAILNDENAKMLIHEKFYQTGKGKNNFKKQFLFRPSKWKKK